MSIATFTLNGIPVESLGVAVLASTSGWLDLSKRIYPTAAMPLRQGVQALSYSSMTDPRVWSLQSVVQATGFLDRRAKVNALYAALRGRIEVVSMEDPSKACYGVLTQAPTHFQGIGMVTPDIDVMAEITCHDPLWYDLTPQSVTIAAPNTPYVVPVGSEAMRRAIVTIQGPCTNPVLIMKNNAGVELQRMTFTLTLTSAQYLVIDMDAYTATLSDGTDEADAMGVNDTYMAFDPADNPTIEIDVASGTAIGTLTCYRAFLA